MTIQLFRGDARPGTQAAEAAVEADASSHIDGPSLNPEARLKALLDEFQVPGYQAADGNLHELAFVALDHIQRQSQRIDDGPPFGNEALLASLAEFTNRLEQIIGSPESKATPTSADLLTNARYLLTNPDVACKTFGTSMDALCRYAVIELENIAETAAEYPRWADGLDGLKEEFRVLHNTRRGQEISFSDLEALTPASRELLVRGLEASFDKVPRLHRESSENLVMNLKLHDRYRNDSF